MRPILTNKQLNKINPRLTPSLFKNHRPRTLLSESQKRIATPNNLQDPKTMIICAGLPKTGSKSCSAALRKLGQDIQMYTKW